MLMQFSFFWVAIIWTSGQYRVSLNYLSAAVEGFRTLLKKFTFEGCLHAQVSLASTQVSLLH